MIRKSILNKNPVPPAPPARIAPVEMISVKEAARILGCGEKSIKTRAVGNFSLVRYTAGKTAPIFVPRNEVEAFLSEKLTAARAYAAKFR